MNHTCSIEDKQYLKAFEAYEIDAATFHHREHLRIAYVLIATYGLEVGFARMKESLLGLLTHLGVGTEKYNETLTYAWLLVVNHFMHTSSPSGNFDEFIRENGLLLDVSIMNTHYSPGLLRSKDARSKYVPPDLEPIPVYNSGKLA